MQACLTDMDIRTLFDIPSRYLFFPEEEENLCNIMIDTNLDSAEARIIIVLGCGAMCKGYILCAPEIFEPLPRCNMCAIPRRDNLTQFRTD